MRIGVAGIPFAGGQSHGGVMHAPHALRRRGLIARLGQVEDARVFDYGDVPGLSRSKLAVAPAIRESARIARELSRMGDDSDLAIHLGGDHGVGLGTIASTLRRHPDAAVVWVDAHGDINSPETSPSGNFHGMPLAMAMGAVDSASRGRLAWLPRWLDPARLVIVGARSLDPGELELIAKCGVRVHAAREIRERGIHAVMGDALAAVSRGGARPLHLSFDIDAIDPEHAPSTGTPVEKGLSADDGHQICRRVALTGRLVAMDLVEYNPRLSPEHSGATADLAIGLIATAAAHCPVKADPRWWQPRSWPAGAAG